MNDYYGDGPVAPVADGGFLAQLPSIIWQRKWLMIVPAVLGLIGAVAAVLLLPRQYTSSATLLVQSPSLPGDVIGTGADSDIINRRIERLRQQVVSRPKLLAMIETNELYLSERARKPLSAVIETMRDDISLTTIDAEVNAAKAEDKTIAFKLSYHYDDPRKSQAVTQALMEQIVDLNSTADVAQANQTVQFLTEQATNLKTEIADLERQVSGISTRFGGILARAGAPMMGNTGGYDLQITDLRRSNQMLAMQKQNMGTADERDPVVVNAEAGLAAARAVYAESHPDVKLAKQRLEEAKVLAAQNIKKVPVSNIDEQIANNNAEIVALNAAKARDQAQAAAAVSSQSRGPAIQQESTQLQQKLEGYYKQYDMVSQRLMTAQAGARAANEQLGERLVVVDPPVVPDKPSSPNRPLILAGGLAGGIGLGLVLALAVEMFLRPIRTPGKITQVIGRPTLALVPLITSRAEARRPSRWRRIGARLRPRNPFRRRKEEAA